MPTPKLLADSPPFPDDVRTAQLERVTLAGLLSGDPAESDKLYKAATDHGFFLLDFATSPDAEELLKLVEDAFELGPQFFNEPLETKKEFKLNNAGCG